MVSVAAPIHLRKLGELRPGNVVVAVERLRTPASSCAVVLNPVTAPGCS